jgi:hypothetical protein
VSYFYPYQYRNRAGVLQPVQDGVVSHAAEPREVRFSYRVKF